MIDSDKAFAAFKRKYDAMSSNEKELYLQKVGFSLNSQLTIQEESSVIGRAIAYRKKKGIPGRGKNRHQSKKENQSNRYLVVKRYK